MVCKVAGDATNRVVDRRELGEVREASAIFCSAVCGVRKVGKRFARAENQSVIGIWKCVNADTHQDAKRKSLLLGCGRPNS